MAAHRDWPEKIGAYEVVSHLGRGRTSDVFEVRNPSGVCRGVTSLRVDGERVEGTLVPVASMKGETRVVAVLG